MGRENKDIPNNTGTGFETLDLEMLLMLNKFCDLNDIEKRLLILETKFDLLEKLL